MTKPVVSRESFSARIWRKTLAGVGVKFGLIWIALLIFCAVFAPFLANSMPLLMSKDGVISAPVLEYLSVEDAWILTSFFIALAVYRLKIDGGKQILWFLLGSALAALLVNSFVKPPVLVIYDDFRSAAYTQVDWKIMPPIPYAPVDYLRDLGSKGLEAPFATDGHTHLMGTEENGADVLSRMIHACRISLSIGLIASGIALAIGIVVGGLMGYFSGIVDMLGMRLVEIFEDIPTLFLLLTFVAFFGRSLYMMMVIIGVTGWSGYARYVRQEFLKLRKQDYVQAAVASGLPLTSILFRHMLPNGVAPLLVAVSFGVAGAILSEATLSFLGLGVVDAPSWGAMLDQAVKSSTFNWWMAVFPGGSIFMTVFAYNLIGEAFRDAIDPRLSDKAGIKS
ncbi:MULTISPECIES: ABC transporter permease [Methylomonas]|uniref:ABC transporter permease n=2 Tax=Methylomonas TaxID=416 RepID=A0A126T7J7_9GAMM|nr:MULTISPECIES: ABC transporter permease [Methylomonas]AMK78010.1 ABC transporter permease [Methylomonas denitrificans]OAI07689.1 ABC transporter permease [Methylomonas methanica]TCV85546.1 peptide/nickel transport system permease protein [Methylomonas methanica]